MKNLKPFTVIYNGNNSRWKNFKHMVMAYDDRDAVEKTFSHFFDYSYFPQDDESIKDCDGNTICNPDDSRIRFDGGFFEVQENKK